MTAYLAQRIAGILLWAPTQRHAPDYDLAGSLPGPGKLFVLEDKAPYTNRHAHHFELQVRQMWNYLRDPHLRARAFYVLPCPPFSVAAVPGGPGAAAAPRPDLVPRRARSRLAGHPWAGRRPCEEWFRVVPVLDLWTHCLAGAPPAAGAPSWPVRGHRPAGAPAATTRRLACPLPAKLGETLKVFVDRLLRCDRPELRVDPEEPNDVDRVADGAADSPLYQALIAFAPASGLPGWSRLGR